MNSVQIVDADKSEAVMDDDLARGNVTLHPIGLLSNVMITAAQKKS